MVLVIQLRQRLNRTWRNFDHADHGVDRQHDAPHGGLHRHEAHGPGRFTAQERCRVDDRSRDSSDDGKALNEGRRSGDPNDGQRTHRLSDALERKSAENAALQSAEQGPPGDVVRETRRGGKGRGNDVLHGFTPTRVPLWKRAVAVPVRRAGSATMTRYAWMGRRPTSAARESPRPAMH